MVRVGVWAGAMQIPRRSTHMRWLQFFQSPTKLSLFGADKASRFLGQVLASSEGHIESCNVDESNKRFTLGRLAKDLIHRTVGFLKS